MNKKLIETIRTALEHEITIDEVRSDLVSQGYMEEEVLDAIQVIKSSQRSSEDKKLIRLFTFKEIFDRIGYGFASIQFINVLFYLTGAGFLVIGLINGLKTIISLLLSSFLKEYSKFRPVSKKFMSKSGILFGISFLFIAMAVSIKSVPLFAAALLVGSIGVVTYGDLYNKVMDATLKKEKMSKFLLGISHYGILITAVSLLLSGYLFDKFSILKATKILIFGKSMPIFGYLIAFEITAIAFILSGYFLNFFKEQKTDVKVVKNFLSNYLIKIKDHTKLFFKNKYLSILLIAGSLTGLVQILGNSFYGIFIYENFNLIVLKGFMNLAVILVIAIIVSFLGPAFSKYLNKKVGLAPTLVFGTLLLAMMPLVAAYNANLMSITVGYSLSVLGAVILGMGQGLLIRKLLTESQRKIYFVVVSLLVIIPFLILIPIGSWIAGIYGLVFLFKILAFILIAIAAPIYFILVLMANKKRL